MPPAQPPDREADPAGRAEAMWTRAAMLFTQGRWDLAIGELRDLLALDPRHVHASGLLAKALAVRGHHDAALHQARQTIALAPDLAYSHDVLAEVCMYRSDYRAAASEAHHAIKLEPNWAEAHCTLARIRFAQRNWDDALHAAEAALAIEPEHVGSLIIRSMALLNLGDTWAAARAARVALDFAPTDAYAHQAHGFVSLQTDDPRGALRHFSEALRANPSLEGARLGFLDARRRLNAWYRATSALSEFLARIGPQLGVIVVVWLTLRSKPALRWTLDPVGFAVVTVLLVCVSSLPLANVMLLMHPVGRHALGRRIAGISLVVAAASVTAIVVCTLAWIDGPASDHGWLFWVTILLPIAGLWWLHRATWRSEPAPAARRPATR